MRVLENNHAMQFASLTQIRRQTNETYRKAVASISKADSIGKDGMSGLESGLATLDTFGGARLSRRKGRHDISRSRAIMSR